MKYKPFGILLLLSVILLLCVSCDSVKKPNPKPTNIDIPWYSATPFTIPKTTPHLSTPSFEDFLKNYTKLIVIAEYIGVSDTKKVNTSESFWYKNKFSIERLLLGDCTDSTISLIEYEEFDLVNNLPKYSTRMPYESGERYLLCLFKTFNGGYNNDDPMYEFLNNTYTTTILYVPLHKLIDATYCGESITNILSKTTISEEELINYVLSTTSDINNKG